MTAIAVLLTGGCAQRSEQAATPPKDGGYPVTVDSSGTKLTIKNKPERIVSLGPSATEDLFAVGAGKQVVAADSLSDYPEGVPRTKLSSIQPNVEAIAGYKPDLVVATDDMNGLSGKLAKLGIPVLFVKAPKDLDGVYGQLTTLGKTTGHEREAYDTTKRMRHDIDKLVEDTPKPAKVLSYFYEADSTLYTATSKTFIGSVFGMFGMRNIADDADKAGSGYPQLSAEKILQSNPDLIFVTDKEPAAAVGARPGWSELKAVQRHQVIELDPSISARWTPRLVDLVREVAKAADEAGK
ncbi:ABC transporter substrate-binding protein [Sciscionella sediminilitoris]|uniref:ABC transporter substrate-binding protein n=1 Tax=Sciscionella sediminilitoris TaxID=1445613 RepID=UPI00068F1BF7|nr:ABC transporter substrate-binding protein [Sciscionella sp. SE31]